MTGRLSSGLRLALAALIAAAQPSFAWSQVRTTTLRSSINLGRTSPAAPAWRASFTQELRLVLRELRPHLRQAGADGAVLFLSGRLQTAISGAERQAGWVAAELLGRPSARWELRRSIENPAGELSEADSQDLSESLGELEIEVEALSPSQSRRLMQGLADIKKEVFGSRLTKEHAAVAIRRAFPAVRHDFSEPSSKALQSADLLKRAALQDVSGWKLARAVKTARDVPAARENLAKLGIIRAGESQVGPTAPNDTAIFDFAVRQLWWLTSPSLLTRWKPNPYEEVPTLAVDRAGIRFQIHGVAHGSRWGESTSLQLVPGPVKRLIKRLDQEHAELYSEQFLPMMISYSRGQEFIDQFAYVDGTANLRPAASPRKELVSPITLTRAAFFSTGLTAAVLAVTSSWIWAPAAVLALAIGAYLTWSLSFMRAGLLVKALRSHWLGLTDLAAFFLRMFRFNRLATDARAVFNRHQLPMPLAAAVDPATLDPNTSALRSKAMADAAWLDARARGLKEAHLIVGLRHVTEIASYLLSPEVPAGPGPKDLEFVAPLAHSETPLAAYNKLRTENEKR